jgi:hypothetical protein
MRSLILSLIFNGLMIACVHLHGGRTIGQGAEIYNLFFMIFLIVFVFFIAKSLYEYDPHAVHNKKVYFVLLFLNFAIWPAWLLYNVALYG